jgi:hypothetical protein
MEPLFIMALDNLMEIFGLGESHFSLAGRLCLLVGGPLTCACLVDHPLVALLMDVDDGTISLWWFGIYVYLGYG